jgi:hypothetical protein
MHRRHEQPSLQAWRSLAICCVSSKLEALPLLSHKLAYAHMPPDLETIVSQQHLMDAAAGRAATICCTDLLQ